jgi:hypothetical protein
MPAGAVTPYPPAKSRAADWFQYDAASSRPETVHSRASVAAQLGEDRQMTSAMHRTKTGATGSSFLRRAGAYHRMGDERIRQKARVEASL